MARDGSGNYSLPAGNPTVAGTTIASTWANTLATDLATEITNSLDRGGRGGMTAALRLANGSLGTPALAFTSETGLGLYRAASGQLVAGIGGVRQVQIDATDQLSVYRNSGWRRVPHMGELTGSIYGLTISPNASNPTTRIDIATGSVVDAGGNTRITLSPGLTKRDDATWAAGTGNGGVLAFGTHGTVFFRTVWLIRNSTTGAVDVGIHSSIDVATVTAALPSGYDQLQLIGAYPRITGVVNFSQHGNYFHVRDWDWSPSVDSTVTSNTWETQTTTDCPPSCLARLQVSFATTIVSDPRTAIYIAGGDDDVPTLTAKTYIGYAVAQSEAAISGVCYTVADVWGVPVNASRQFKTAAYFDGAGGTMTWKISGYVVPQRGNAT